MPTLAGQITTILTSNAFTFVGVSDSATSLHASMPSATAVLCGNANAPIWNGNTNTGITLGSFANGDVICMALDISAGLMWFRKGSAGNWNGNSSNNPATAVGGINVSSIVSASKPAFAICSVYHNGTSGGVTRLNAGASAFVGAVPAGFYAGFGAVS